VTAALVVAIEMLAAANWWSRVERAGGSAVARTRVEAFTKPLVTLGIAVLALAADAGHAGTLTVIALVLCLAGDVALLPAVDRFVAGLAAFLVGHVVFVASFVVRGLDRLALGGVALIAAALLIATVGNVIVRGATASSRSLRRPVLGYLIVIAAMAAVGWATGDPLVIAGSTAFVVSDAVLGWRQFVRPVRAGGLVVMATYHLALGLLALSLW